MAFYAREEIDGEKYWQRHAMSVLEKADDPMKFTGERYLPFTDLKTSGVEIHYEHLHRYAFASQFVQGKSVLDLASGEGYGSYMLSQEADHVVGVEIDPEAVDHARTKYPKNNLEFMLGSILEIPIQGEHIFDVVVCFEAIEHVSDHNKLLSEVKRLLKEDGLFIVSTPNKEIYTDKNNYHNPFHLKELYLKEFSELLHNYFTNIYFWGQKVYTVSSMWPLFEAGSISYSEFVMEKGDAGFYFKKKQKKLPLYMIAMASNSSNDIDLIRSFLIDESNTSITHRDEQISALTVRADTLERWVIERDSRIVELDAQLRASNERAHELEQMAIERDGRIVELDAQLRASNERAHELEQMAIERDSRIVEFDAQLRASNERAHELEQMAIERDSRIVELDEQLRASNERAHELEQMAIERDSRIVELDEQLRASNERAHELEQMAIERDSRIVELDEQLQASNERAHELEQMAIERDGRIVEFDAQLRASNERAHELEQMAIERDGRLAELGAQLRASNERAHELEQMAIEREGGIAELDAQLRASNERSHELEQNVIERDGRLAELDAQLQFSRDRANELNNVIAEMQRSVVWQMMMKYHYGFVDKVLPQGTGLRGKYDLALKGARIAVNDGWGSFFRSLGDYTRNQRLPHIESQEAEFFSSEDNVEQPRNDRLVYRQKVPLKPIFLETKVSLKKGSNLIRLHIPEGCERPSEIPNMKSGDARCLSVAVRDMAIRDGDVNFLMNLGANWHGIEYSDEGSFRWLSNDATVIVDSNKNCNATLSLGIYSFYNPRTVEIYMKSISTNIKFRRDEGKKFILLKDADRKIEKDIVKNELERIIEALRGRI